MTIWEAMIISAALLPPFDLSIGLYAGGDSGADRTSELWSQFACEWSTMRFTSVWMACNQTDQTGKMNQREEVTCKIIRRKNIKQIARLRRRMSSQSKQKLKKCPGGRWRGCARAQNDALAVKYNNQRWCNNSVIDQKMNDVQQAIVQKEANSMIGG